MNQKRVQLGYFIDRYSEIENKIHAIQRAINHLKSCSSMIIHPSTIEALEEAKGIFENELKKIEKTEVIIIQEKIEGNTPKAHKQA